MVWQAEHELMFNPLLYFIWFALSEQLVELFFNETMKAEHVNGRKGHCGNVQ